MSKYNPPFGLTGGIQDLRIGDLRFKTVGPSFTKKKSNQNYKMNIDEHNTQDEIETVWGDSDSESDKEFDDFTPLETFVTVAILQIGKEENIITLLAETEVN